MWRGRSRPRHAAKRIRSCSEQVLGIESVRIGDPSQAAGSDTSDAKGDSVTLGQFQLAIFKQADERPVHVAEAEKAEVEMANGEFLVEWRKPAILLIPSPWCARA